MKKKKKRNRKNGGLQALSSFSLFSLHSPLSLSQRYVSFFYPSYRKKQAGDHAFPKRRILQDSSSTSSSGGDSSTSTSSFSNTVTGTDDSPDRVEVSPAVSLAESPLSDAELCAVSKQVKEKKQNEKRKR